MRQLALIAVLGSLGCQEPFGTDRHDLVGLRVAAVGARSAGQDQVQLDLAAVVEGRPWSEEPLQIAWFDASNLDVDEIVELPPQGGVASGPAPILGGTGPGTLALVVSDGTLTWRGTLSLPQIDTLGAPPELGRIEARKTSKELSALTGTELDLDARRAWELGDATDSIDAGSFVRLSVDTPVEAEIRWMATAPGGTFLEVEQATTDWVAASFVRDDEDIEDIEVEGSGARTVVALAIDPDHNGANAWRAREIFVGEVPVGVFTHSGRFVPTDTPIEASFVRGRLVSDDAAPAGVRLDDAQAATAEDDPGTAALPCTVPVSGPFDPDWLLDQRCARSQVVGATVVVQVRP